VTDVLPAGGAFLGGAGGGGFSCAASGQSLTCTSSHPIVSGAPVVIDLAMTVGTSAGTALSDDASVSPHGGRSSLNTVEVILQAGVLVQGTELASTKSIFSPNGDYRLTMQAAGNLVECDGSAPVWASGTNSSPVGDHAGMQPDGHFVVYSSSGGVKWATGTNGNPGAYLAPGDEGGLEVLSALRDPLWGAGGAA
jgi:hypothetical protein